MAFRDDRRALSERARVLEGELQRTREELAKAKEDDAEMATLREQLARLEGELTGLKRGLGPGASLPDWVRLATVALVGGLVSAGLFAAFSSSPEPHPSAESADESDLVQADHPEPQTEQPFDQQEPQTEQPVDRRNDSLADLFRPTEPVQSAEEAGIFGSLWTVWSLTPGEVTGYVDIGSENECALGALITDLRFHAHRTGHHLEVRCRTPQGTETLFQWGGPVEGVVLREVNLYEQSADGGFTYQLVAHDRSAGGPALEVDTPSRSVSLTGPGERSIRFRVPAESQVWSGRPAWGNDLAPILPPSRRRIMSGRVESSTGSDAPREGARCRISVDAAHNPRDSVNCRPTVRCQGRTYFRDDARCRVREGLAIDVANPLGHGTQISADLNAGRLDLGNDTGATWTARLAVEDNE